MTKGERTRQYIIEQTASIFNKKGYAGTSLSDLTEASGLTKGAIYRNFASKDEVALAAFDYNLAKIIQGISALQEKQPSALGKLRAFIDFYRKAFYNEDFRVGCPLANTATEADDTHPDLRQRVVEALERWRKGIEGLIMQGIAEKEIQAHVDPKSFAFLMITMIEGGFMLAKVSGDLRYLNQALDQLEEIIATQLVNKQ